MKVILLQDVKNVGKKDSLIEVSEGYARNFLFKKNLAVAATNDNLNLLKQKQGANAARIAREKAEAEASAKTLEGKTFTLKMKCGEGGKLYGALTSANVAECLVQAGYNIDKRNIVLQGNIKNTGRVVCKLKLYQDVSCNINVNVEAL